MNEGLKEALGWAFLIGAIILVLTKSHTPKGGESERIKAAGTTAFVWIIAGIGAFFWIALSTNLLEDLFPFLKPPA